MRTTTFAVSALALVAVAYVASQTSAPGQTTAQPPAAPSAASSYDVDPVHSTIVFGLTHLGVSYFYGRINGPFGTFNFNPDSPGSCSFDIKASAEKIDTNNGRRDGHLKSADFFNAKQFPEMTFKSTSVKKGAKNTWQVTGDLTIKGVTKSITIDLEHIGTADTQQGHRCGFRTGFKVKRSDFGITYMPDGLGDEVTLMIGLEGTGK